MDHALECYLRTYRKRSGFTQEDVAFLLAKKSGQLISRYERLQRRPGLRTLIACELLYGASLRKLYPGLTRDIESELLARARSLHRTLKDQQHTGHVAYKLSVLNEIMRRLCDEDKQDV